jgi:outer membrane protein assembly factor BamB
MMIRINRILKASGLAAICAGMLTVGAASAQDRDPNILWWHDLMAPSFGSSATGDIDGDGHLEIVFGTYFNDEHVYALNAEDGSLLWSFDTGGCNDASPVIYDVDQDGALEVVIPASSPCIVYCFTGATGAVEWSYNTYPHSIDSPPAVGDVDNDGRPEVVFGAFHGYVYCLNGEDGSPVWQVNLGTNSYIQSDPAILDLDADGQLDVVVAQWAGDERIYALRGNDGSALWFSDLPEDYMYHGASFADIDEDNLPEIVIGSYDGDLYVLNAENGSLAWEYTGILYIGAPTSIADLNRDGHLEIVFAYYNSVKVLSHTGAPLWTYTTGGSVFRGAAIADVNADGMLDVLFGSDDGILRALRGGDGAVIWTINLEAHYGLTFNMDHAPVIADFNGDDSLDVFVIGGYGSSSQPTRNHGRAYALTAGAGNGPGWPMFRHDERHSGVFLPESHDVTIAIEPINPPIVIPGGGGRFGYYTIINNLELNPVNFFIWIMVRLPNGRWSGPVLGPVNLTLPGGGALTRQRSQTIPGSAPAGNYIYCAYVGPGFAAKWDSSSFSFEKLGAGDCGDKPPLRGGSGAGEWENDGGLGPGGW